MRLPSHSVRRTEWAGMCITPRGTSTSEGERSAFRAAAVKAMIEGGFTRRLRLRNEGSEGVFLAHPTLGLATAPNVSEVPSVLQQRRQ